VVWHWRGHISMRAAVITCGGAVRRAAKKAGGSKKKGSSRCKTDNVSYSRSRASSVYSNNRIGHSHGKGRLDSNQAWSARHNRRGQWWQMDLGSRKSVGGVVTQGRTAHGQYVTHYKVQVSDNGRNFRWVDGGRVMRANSGSNNHKKTNKFRKRVSARYVRIVVWHWRGHISMRAAVITCGGAVRRAAKKAGGSKKKGSSRCKTDNVSYSRSKASSVWSNNRIGHSHGKGRLDSNQAWSARHNRRGQWWQMDLGSRKSVGGVVTQGRTAHGQYVTHYRVQVSDNGRNFRWVDGGRVMRANSGSNNHKKTNKFRKRVSARYVRIVVWHWRGHISMRAAVITCGGARNSSARKAANGKCKKAQKDVKTHQASERRTKKNYRRLKNTCGKRISTMSGKALANFKKMQSVNKALQKARNDERKTKTSHKSSEVKSKAAAKIRKLKEKKAKNVQKDRHKKTLTLQSRKSRELGLKAGLKRCQSVNGLMREISRLRKRVTKSERDLAEARQDGPNH